VDDEIPLNGRCGAASRLRTVTVVTADHLVPGLIAQNGHGPQMHGAALLVLLVLAVVAGLVFVLRARRRSDRDHPDDRRSES
jgi:hypothetical protein